MGLFDFLIGKDINKGYEEYQHTKDAVLLDVREKDEFKSGHIKGAKNLPLSSIDKVKSLYKDKNKPIFLYCASGARSGNAEKIIKSMGYDSAKNIGGIMRYKGQLVK